MTDRPRCALKPPADANCGPGCCCVMGAYHTTAHQTLCGAKWAGSITLKGHDGGATQEPTKSAAATPAGPRLNKTQVGKIHAALVEFGYANLTFKETEDAVNRVLAASDKRGDIIDMMVRSMLEDAKIVEAKKS
jgi:hypothetical protein